MLRRFLIGALLLLPITAQAQVRTSDTAVSNFDLQAAIQSVDDAMDVRKNSDIVDSRFELTTQAAIDNYYNVKELYDQSFTTVGGNYYHEMQYDLPETFWTLDNNFKYLFYLDFETNVTTPVLPDIPVNADLFTRLNVSLRHATGNSMGSNGVDQIPLTWRNALNTYQIFFERQELSSAQQVSLVQGIEREVLAGMSSAYTSTSTTRRYIDFQQTAAGANDPLVQADLVALGWTIVNATQMEKIINGFRWRVLHNS